jgi:hypothetical protein
MPFLRLLFLRPGAAPAGEHHSTSTARQQEISPMGDIHALFTGKFAYY